MKSFFIGSEMMDSFAFALNTTMPVFLVILLGWFLRRVGVLNAEFCKPANQYVFKCALPVSLFLSIAKMDVYSCDGKYMANMCSISLTK